MAVGMTNFNVPGEPKIPRGACLIADPNWEAEEAANTVPIDVPPGPPDIPDPSIQQIATLLPNFYAAGQGVQPVTTTTPITWVPNFYAAGKGVQPVTSNTWVPNFYGGMKQSGV